MSKYLRLKTYSDFVLNQFLKLIFPLIRVWEHPKIMQCCNKPLYHQPLFIIGAPRTGSTILYQALTNLYDVLYIDNLVCKFHSNLFFGFRLSNKLFGTRPHNNFRSQHGRTEGWHSPSECGQFWYRWLPKDRHFIDYDDITLEMVEGIRKEITAVINYFGKPLVFKNLNAGQRMRLLTKCFPKAKFIFITRDPLQTAQSILKAKRRAGFHDNEFWSIMPSNVEKLKRLDWDEQIVKQVYFLEEQILRDKSLVYGENFFIIHYNDLSLQQIEKLAKEIGLKKRENPQKPIVEKNGSGAVAPAELECLKAQVEELYWNDLHKGSSIGKR